MKINKQKKAISPLISVILIVALSIAIGSLIIEWAIDQNEETAETASQRTQTATKCSLDTQINLWQNSDGSEELCYDNSTDNLYFTISNGPREKLYGLIIQIRDENGTFELKELDEKNANLPLDKAFTQRFNVSVGMTQEPYEVRILPTIKVKEELTTCSQAKIQREVIRSCS